MGKWLSYCCVCESYLKTCPRRSNGLISDHLPLITVELGRIYYCYEKMVSSYRLNRFPLQISKPIYNLIFFMLTQIVILIIDNCLELGDFYKWNKKVEILDILN